MQRLIAMLCLLIFCDNTYAWGDTGHQVIAMIAWHYLSPKTRNQIETLLKNDNSDLTATDFVNESTWADAYRDSDRNTTRIRYEQTRRWHYINLEIAHPDFAHACFGSAPLTPLQNASAGAATACVVDKVEQFAAELKSDKTSPAERLIALQFLIHLVGDLHQPLHACENNDSGGNEVHIAAKGLKRESLHAYWDNSAVSLLGRKPEIIARKLMAYTGQSELARWRSGNPHDWTLEAFTIGRDDVYPRLPHADADGAYTLDDDYAAMAKTIAAQQLIKAGVRLAWLLEQSISRE